jgi:hypothetical protein
MNGPAAMQSTEIEALVRRDTPRDDARRAARLRVVLLFLLVVVGVLAAWFWDVGSTYLASTDPNKELEWGTFGAFIVRSGLALIVAGLTFPTIYEKVAKPTKDSWIAFFLAFQNGFSGRPSLRESKEASRKAVSVRREPSLV